MNSCPFCHKTGTLRRGRPVHGRETRYYAVCMTCGSYLSVPFHEYFQLYSRQSECAASDCLISGTTVPENRNLPLKPVTADREMAI